MAFMQSIGLNYSGTAMASFFIKQRDLNLAVFAGLLLASCGGSGSGGNNGGTPQPPPPSTVATLAGLSLSAGTLVPAFQPATIDYTVSVENAVSAVAITPTSTDPGATIMVNNEAVSSGGATSDIALAAVETALNIVVTAEDGVTTRTYTVTVTRRYGSFELLDPTPGASNEFGSAATFLGNGNIVINDPGDSSVAFDSGAVHLFDPFNQTLISSFYGDQAGDQVGNEPVTALHNGNYVVVSRFDDDGGAQNTGGRAPDGWRNRPPDGSRRNR